MYLIDYVKRIWIKEPNKTGYSDNIEKAWFNNEKVLAASNLSGIDDPEYKKKTKNIQRSMLRYINACQNEGLNHLKVNDDIKSKLKNFTK